jgi:uncharacterized protein (DUF433 family)
MSSPLIISDPDILGGTPVFAGTRVPVRLLFDNLADGASLSEILEAFPTLQREQAVEALRSGRFPDRAKCLVKRHGARTYRRMRAKTA